MAELSASVECIDCQKALGALPSLSRHELCGVIESLLVASHAAQPHCNHALRAVVEGASGVERELTIRCKHRHCAATVPPFVVMCPIELVGALTIVFHASHEGHPLELTYDGRTWSSPLH